MKSAQEDLIIVVKDDPETVNDKHLILTEDQHYELMQEQELGHPFQGSDVEYEHYGDWR